MLRGMKPKITIEVSATPHMTSDYRVVVEFEDVKTEGMIKKEVAINPSLKEDKLEGKGSDEFILEQAEGIPDDDANVLFFSFICMLSGIIGKP